MQGEAQMADDKNKDIDMGSGSIGQTRGSFCKARAVGGEDRGDGLQSSWMLT